MNEHNENSKKLRLTIILTSIVGLLSSFSITVTTFAYGIGDDTPLILLLFPTLLLSIILIIAKIRLGFVLTFLVALTYAYLLTSEVGKFLIFNFNNSVLLLVLLLPYVTFLTLIPLTTIYFTQNLRQNNFFKIGSIVLAIAFFIFTIADRYNKDYFDSIFIDAEINEQGQIRLNCKPSFADSRTFYITANSKELAEQIRECGEYYQGSYFLQNTKITKNFSFTELKSITIKKFGDNKLKPELTWTKNELRGDLEFLRP